jgi:hypothetical protein
MWGEYTEEASRHMLLEKLDEKKYAEELQERPYKHKTVSVT